jgi:hypothetical protein
MVTGPVMRDQFYVFGLWVPKNTGSDEAVLESVKPSNPSSSRGLEMRYGAIRVPNRGCQIGSARGWPPLGCRGGSGRSRAFTSPVVHGPRS